MPYLLKTEPSVYSFADLQREGATIWDGVSNPVALKNMRAMSPGDQLVIYETADVKSAVGTATVVSVDTSDPKNPRVEIKAGKPLADSAHAAARPASQTRPASGSHVAAAETDRDGAEKERQASNGLAKTEVPPEKS